MSEYWSKHVNCWALGSRMFEHWLESLLTDLFYCMNDPPNFLFSSWLIRVCRPYWAMLVTCVRDVDSARRLGPAGLANKCCHLFTGTFSASLFRFCCCPLRGTGAEFEPLYVQTKHN